MAIPSPLRSIPPLFKYSKAEVAISTVRDFRIRFTPSNELNDLHDQCPVIHSTPAHLSKMAIRYLENEYLLEMIRNGQPPTQQGCEAYVAHNHASQVEFATTVVKKNPDLGSAIRDHMSKDYGILCLSETKDNHPMWAFYAEEHQGAVIEFATSKAFFVEDPMLRPVNYSDTRPMTHYGDTSLGHTYEKSLDWQYEREWRTQERFRKMNPHTLKDGKTIHLMSVPPECFKAVYLGARIETEQKKQFLDLVKEEKHRHIALYQCQPSLTQFALQFLPASD